MKLEIVSRADNCSSAKPPLLFVHGAYVGAWCWEEHFLDWFAARGFASHAVSLRGHGGSEGREQLDAFSLADYAEDVASAVAALPSPPVMIGHSMGAQVVQKYLEKAEAPAAVLACPVPPFGLLPASFSLAFTRPALFMELNAVQSGGRASAQALAEALYAVMPEPAVLERRYRRMQRESNRALLEMSGWSVPLASGRPRPPTLVLGAEKDVLFSAAEARTSAALLGAEFELLPGLGHAIMLDAGWESAAKAIAQWLESRF